MSWEETSQEEHPKTGKRARDRPFERGVTKGKRCKEAESEASRCKSSHVYASNPCGGRRGEKDMTAKDIPHAAEVNT
jgi:hypothetical protein